MAEPKIAPVTVFPNYLQLRERAWLPLYAWHWLRAGAVLGALAMAAYLFVAPAEGLNLFWKVIVPVLPAVFFVAPGLWRNICPLAAANQAPRLFGFTKGLTPPPWLKEYAFVIGIALLAVLVTSRKWLFNHDGEAAALMILGALLFAFLGGLLFKGKSGWCSSLCPMLPVERLYNQTPFVLVANSHCTPCVGCTKNCYDFNPLVANLADLADDDPYFAGYRKFFVAAFPGLILGYFLVPDPPAIGTGAMYSALLVYVLGSVGAFFFLSTFFKTSSYRLTVYFAIGALNLFYWFVIPVWLGAVGLLAGVPVGDAAAWVLRAAVGAASLAWVFRSFRKEGDFLRQRLKGEEVRVSSAAARALRKVGDAVRAEVLFKPGDVKVLADPGKTLLEIAEANRMPLEAGCRMGMCGADPVCIQEGMESLPPMGEEERATLERLGLDAVPGARLACMCRVQGPVTVSVERPSAAAPGAGAAGGDAAIGRIVVVGNGIAGVTAADYARRTHPDCEIHLVARERHHLYNRMAITRLVYGQSAMIGLYLQPDAWYEERRIACWLNTHADAIDRAARKLRLATGEELAYDRLVLACGSRSAVPEIPGYGLPGSFGLRDADEAMEIRAYAQRTRARRAVIAGGGLLGLEAAYALHKLGLAVTVLERGEWLLRRQLDRRGAFFLRGYLERLGIEVVTQAETARLHGAERVREVELKDGRNLPADVYVLCIGITPNVELAREAGLEVAAGVKVDERMRTSDPAIFAAGDLCEWEGRVGGLWPVAVEQGRVAGINAAGGDATYKESPPVTTLKVVGMDLTSIGRFEAADDQDAVIVHEQPEEHRYRKLVVRDNRIVGAILIGYGSDTPAVSQAIRSGKNVGPVMERLREGVVTELA